MKQAARPRRYLWILTYRIQPLFGGKINYNRPALLAFFYAVDEKDARKQANAWKAQQNQYIVEEDLKRSPYGFRWGQTSLPPDIAD